MTDNFDHPRWNVMTRPAIVCAMMLSYLLLGTETLFGFQLQFQPLFPNSRTAQNEENSVGSFPYDRALSNALDKCRKLLEKKSYADAFEGLDRILSQSKDSALKPVKGNDKYVSLKSEAMRLIGTLPEEGMAAYRLQFGITAEKLLTEAIESGDAEKLNAIVRRYFHTEAGYKASLLLARHHLDHGRPLAAAQILQSLNDSPRAVTELGSHLSVLSSMSWYRSGNTDRAVSSLTGLATKQPDLNLKLKGKKVPLSPAASQAKDWLSENLTIGTQSISNSSKPWLMFRGSPSRNLTNEGGSPLLNRRWEASVTDDVAVNHRLSEEQRGLLRQNLPAVPTLQAIALDNVIIYRTPLPNEPIHAIDFESGKLIWYVGKNTLLTSTAGFDRNTVSTEAAQDRAWKNMNYGSLSSDGERFYFVEDDGQPNNQNEYAQQNWRMGRRGWFGPQSHNVSFTRPNRLFACGIATQGMLNWVIGADSESDADSPLAGAVFLGPPLPLQGVLYSLVELKQAISLVALDPKTGKLLWQQEIFLLDEQSQQIEATWRRKSGITPSYAEGKLICPTATGSIVAVDLNSRSLAWAHILQKDQANTQYLQSFYESENGFNAQFLPGSFWAETTIVVSGNYVLFTGPESNRLVCLDLLTGTPKWERRRGQNNEDGIYIGGVYNDKVLIVGKQSVNCIRVQDQKPVWKAPLPLANSSVPTGRGFASKGNYYLPVSSGEVLKIDLEQGVVKSSSKASRGTIPGNLISHKGYVFSLGVDRLEKYSQIDPLREAAAARLKENGNDPKALGWRGEIEIDEGKIDEGLRDLKLAHAGATEKLKTGGAAMATADAMELESDIDRLRSLIFDTLHRTILSDLGKNSEKLAELKEFIATDADRVAWMRLTADSHLARNEKKQAYEAFMSLAEMKNDSNHADEIDLNYEISRDAWIQSRLKKIWASASTDERSEFDQMLNARWERIEASDPTVREMAVDRYLKLFTFHESSEKARLKMLQFLGSEAPIRSETILKILEQSKSAEIRRQVTARLASLYQSMDQNDQAAKYYRKLRDQFGDELITETQTGKQFFESVPKHSSLGAMLTSSKTIPWLQGRVDVDAKIVRGAASNAQSNFSPLDIISDGGAINESYQMLYDQATYTLLIRDGLGKIVQRVNLNQDNSLAYFHHLAVRGFVHNHILLLNLGWRVIAIDLLKKSAGDKSILWRVDFASADQLQLFNNNGTPVMPNYQPNAWGLVTRSGVNPFSNPPNQPYGDMAICGNSGIAVFHHSELSLLDLYTGKPIWTRRGLPANAKITGDDENIVVITRKGKESLVVKTQDGTTASSIDLPERVENGDLFITAGCKLTYSENASSKKNLIFLDMITGAKKLLGTYTVSNSRVNGTSRAVLLDARTLAITSPKQLNKSGHFEVFSLETGERELDAEFPLEATFGGKVLDARVMRNESQYLLVVQTSAQAFSRPPNFVNYQNPYMDGANATLFSGMMYAIDRKSGQHQWTTPVIFDQYYPWVLQPSELPCLVLVRAVNSTTPRRPGTLNNVNNNAQQTVSVLCIDKLTGRAVFQSDTLPGQLYQFDVSADAEKQTLTMLTVHVNGQAAATATTLTFTDKPRPPEPAYQATIVNNSKTVDDNSVLGGIMNAVDKGIAAKEKQAEKKVEKKAEEKKEEKEVNPFD